MACSHVDDEAVVLRVFGNPELSKHGLCDRDEEVKGLQLAHAAGCGTA